MFIILKVISLFHISIQLFAKKPIKIFRILIQERNHIYVWYMLMRKVKKRDLLKLHEA